MSGEHVRLDVLRVRSVRDSEVKLSGKRLNTWCLVFLQTGSSRVFVVGPNKQVVRSFQPVIPLFLESMGAGV